MAALTARGRGLDCLQPQSRLPTGRFSLAGSSLPGRRARRARFPTCGVVRVAGYSVVWDCDPTSIFFPKSTKRSAAAIFGRSAPSYVLWCTSEYSVVGRISCHVSHDNIGINVCQRSFAEFFLAAADSESNRFYPCFRESRDVVSADIPVC